MNLDQKKQYAEKLKIEIEASPLLGIVDYRGITVEEINGIRRSFEKIGVRYVVIKNTILKKITEGTDRQDIHQYLNGMTGLILSNDDAIGTAKSILDITKEFKNQKFILKGGYFDGDTLDPAGIKRVSTLPSKEELLTMLLRTVQEGPRQVIGVIQGPARDLVNLIKNYEHQLETGE
jgi:large subunit ribosomal protein L10